MDGWLRKAVVWLWVVVLGCGYHLTGHGTGILTDDLRVIGVPPLGGTLLRVELRETLLRHIVDALARRTGREIQTQAEGADAVLQVTVKRFQVIPIGWDERGRARTFQVNLALSVQLIRTRDQHVLFQNPQWLFRSQFVLDDPTVVTYTDQEALAIDRIGRTFAESLVSAVLEAF